MSSETDSYVLVWNTSSPAIAFSVTSECVSPMRLTILLHISFFFRNQSNTILLLFAIPLWDAKERDHWPSDLASRKPDHDS